MELLDFDSVCQISHSQTHMEPFSENKKDRNISPLLLWEIEKCLLNSGVFLKCFSSTLSIYVLSLLVDY